MTPIEELVIKHKIERLTWALQSLVRAIDIAREGAGYNAKLYRHEITQSAFSMLMFQMKVAKHVLNKDERK